MAVVGEVAFGRGAAGAVRCGEAKRSGGCCAGCLPCRRTRGARQRTFVVLGHDRVVVGVSDGHVHAKAGARLHEGAVRVLRLRLVLAWGWRAMGRRTGRKRGKRGREGVRSEKKEREKRLKV